MSAPWPAPLRALEWGTPWLSPYRHLGESLAQVIMSGEPMPAVFSQLAVETGLSNQAGRPLAFVPQHELPTGVAYETYIFDTGRVPTRDTLHDFFNALIWLHFPLTKARLNAIQAQQIQQLGQQLRGPIRDAATLFDENAALVLANTSALPEAVRTFAWRRAFIDLRASWAEARVLVFGHALLEKLVTPYRAITAHAFFSVSATPSVWPDVGLAHALAAMPLDSRVFAPLPVLGIPGWCAENSDPAYYDDTAVFRPGRRNRT
jgi:hypothetical protein